MHAPRAAGGITVEKRTGFLYNIIVIRQNHIFVLVLVLSMLFTGLFSTAAVKRNADSNVLVITLDTTRADHIGIYGYDRAQTPHIDAVAGKGVRFEHAYSAVPLTFPSHCTIFTGTLPLYHNVRNNGRYKLPTQIDTLAEILGKKGFITAAFVSSFTVDSRFGLDQGFDIYNDNLVTKKGGVKTYISERPAAMVYEDFAAWFEGHSHKKFFAWVHFFDPHMPYAPPEPYKSQFRDDPYDGEIAYMDAYVGKIIGLLEKEQVLENTLIVLAGDHGEAFGEHGEYGHMMFCYEENLKVPLIFSSVNRLPENKTVEARAGLADIMPTVLDFLEIDWPGHLDGTSLLPVMGGNSADERVFYIESVFPWEALGCAPVKGLIEENYKFIDLPKPELYDLEKDPGEKENVYFKKNIKARRLKQSLDRLISTYDPLKFRSDRKLSPAEERKLRTLGYFSTGRKQPSGNLPDPKEKIGSLTAYIRGNRLRGEGKREEAEAQLKRAIEMNPSFSWPYSTLALVYVENGKTGAAMEILKQGISRNPEEYQLKIDYAMLLQKQSRTGEAVEILEGMLKSGKGMVDTGAEVNYLLADLYARKGDMEKAAVGYREALKTEPGNRVLKQKLVYILHRSGRLSEALAIYRGLEKETPNDPGLWMNLAVIYEQLNHNGRSKSYYEKLIKEKLINDHRVPVRIYYNYALLLAKTGNIKEAVKQMECFIDLCPPGDALKKTAEEHLKKWSNGVGE